MLRRRIPERLTLYCQLPRLICGITTPLLRVMVGLGNCAMAMAAAAKESVRRSSMMAEGRVEALWCGARSTQILIFHISECKADLCIIQGTGKPLL